MFGWFRSQPSCPIEAEERAWLDQRWAWLEEEFGSVPLRQSPLILPTPQYFPDPYAGTVDDAQGIFARVCRYMRIDPERVQLTCYAGSTPYSVDANGHTVGANGYYVDEGDTFRIWLNCDILTDPMRVVGTLAHELGHVLLLGEGRITDEEEDHEPLTDLLTVFAGLGIFLANSVLDEQNWSDGRFSVWNIKRSGYLSMRQFGYALALFAQARGDNGRAWKKHLRPDVRGAFKQSLHYLANPNS